MTTQVRVDGVWLTTIGGVGELRWSTVANGGSEQVTWRMPLPDTFTHPALVTGALVELMQGSALIWSGLMAQPDHSEQGWSFTATGLFEELFTAYLCLDSGGDTTSIPDVAVDQAIADGFPVTRPESLSSVAFTASDETTFLNNVGDLLSVWATSEGKRWRINGDRTITAATDPTVPTWYMSPGSARIGLTGDDYASILALRYRDGASTYATAIVGDPDMRPRRAAPVDLTSLGVITSGKAEDIGEGMFAKGKARYAWTEPVNPSRLQLTTPGGQPAYLPFVKAGDMVRTHGVINEQGNVLPYFDWIIGKTEYEDGADTIQLAPTELAARTLGDVLSLAVA